MFDGCAIKRAATRPVLVAFLSMVVVVGVAILTNCKEEPDSVWLEVNEVSLRGDWCSDFRDCNDEDGFSFTKIVLDGSFPRSGGSFTKERGMNYWEEWARLSNFHRSQRLEGDTLYRQVYRKNESCWQGCEGWTSRYKIKVSSTELQMSLIDALLTSGDTLIGSGRWFTYRRIDASKRKEVLVKSNPLPVFLVDGALSGQVYWVNDAGNKAFGFSNNNDFLYIERNFEIGDSTVYSHLKPDNDAPAWHNKVEGTDGTWNVVVLRNVTADGVENLGNWEFEYTITIDAAEDVDVLTIRRIENGVVVGGVETMKRRCPIELCPESFCYGCFGKRRVSQIDAESESMFSGLGL